MAVSSTQVGLEAVKGAPEGDVTVERGNLAFLAMLLPSLLLIGVLFLYPMLGVVERSLGSGGDTFRYYQIPLEHPVYLKVFAITVQIALSVTVLTLAVAYPLAYTIATARPLWSRALIACVLLPFFTSLLVRTYAWMAILSPVGILPR